MQAMPQHSGCLLNSMFGGRAHSRGVLLFPCSGWGWLDEIPVRAAALWMEETRVQRS